MCIRPKTWTRIIFSFLFGLQNISAVTYTLWFHEFSGQWETSDCHISLLGRLTCQGLEAFLANDSKLELLGIKLPQYPLSVKQNFKLDSQKFLFQKQPPNFQIVVRIRLSFFEVSASFMNYVVGSFVTYEASAGKCFHPDSKSIAHKSFVKTLPST